MNAFFTAISIEIFCIFASAWFFYFLLTRNTYDDCRDEDGMMNGGRIKYARYKVW